MGFDVEEYRKQFKEWSESDAGERHFKKFEDKMVLKHSRFKRFEEWLKHNDFDKLMYRIILEHDDEYREKAYIDGHEPNRNNKLKFIFDYVIGNTMPIKVPKLKNSFANEIWEFNGYYFQMTFGQGTVCDVYNKEDLRLLIRL